MVSRSKGEQLASIEICVPKILKRPEHLLSRSGISPNALKVLYRLHRAGYQAYLVGGAVRDLLRGGRPKDFDIGTNARPQEIKRLFRNSRIIGRRFRLAHVLFQGEIVEVSTFRASPEAPESPEDWEQEKGEDAVDESREPEPVDPYGTPEEDALRRDFTINALFYNIADFSVIDRVGGLEDLEAKIIRTVGEPVSRFEEDPVRMMRALEYAERLGFDLAVETHDAIHQCHELITEAAPARLSYELMETLRSGSSSGILRKWQDFGILGRAFSDIERDDERMWEVLEILDRRIAMGGRFPDATLIGAMFLPRFMEIFTEIDRRADRFSNTELIERTRDFLDEAGASMHLPNHVVHLIRQGLFSMTKLRREPTRGRQVLKLVRQDYFPVAWDFFGLATSAGYFDRSIMRSWSRALDRVRDTSDDGAKQDQNPKSKDDKGEGASRPSRRRRPRRRRKV